MPITGFIHCFAVHNWRQILAAQLAQISRSGLMRMSSCVNLVILSPGNRSPAYEPPRGAPLHVMRFSEADLLPSVWNLGEIVTLSNLHAHCVLRDDLVWYIHGKGSSRYLQGWYPAVANWRRLCESIVIGQHQLCIESLSEQAHDVCGPLLSVDGSWPHFSGNFWWARAQHIRRLDPPLAYAGTFSRTFVEAPRFAAEAWLLSMPCRSKDLLTLPQALSPPYLYEHDLCAELLSRGLVPEQQRLGGWPERWRRLRMKFGQWMTAWQQIS